MAGNSDHEWHGWSDDLEQFSGIAIHIGPLPGRKSVALYTIDYTDGATMHVHAYFRSTEEAKKALKFLDELLLGGKK
jgi:hypothetical protein